MPTTDQPSAATIATAVLRGAIRHITQPGMLDPAIGQALGTAHYPARMRAEVAQLLETVTLGGPAGDTPHTTPAAPREIREIRHPEQPDGIDDDSRDYPAVTRAARRVGAYITEWGDGLIDVTNRRPLYARDLAAIVRAVEQDRERLVRVNTQILAELTQTRAARQAALDAARDHRRTATDALNARNRLATDLAASRTRECTALCRDMEQDRDTWQSRAEQEIASHGRTLEQIQGLTRQRDDARRLATLASQDQAATARVVDEERGLRRQAEDDRDGLAAKLDVVCRVLTGTQADRDRYAAVVDAARAVTRRTDAGRHEAFTALAAAVTALAAPGVPGSPADPARDLPPILAVISCALRDGPGMTGANEAFGRLCDRLGVDRDALPFRPDWVDALREADQLAAVPAPAAPPATPDRIPPAAAKAAATVIWGEGMGGEAITAEALAAALPHMAGAAAGEPTDDAETSTEQEYRYVITYPNGGVHEGGPLDNLNVTRAVAASLTADRVAEIAIEQRTVNTAYGPWVPVPAAAGAGESTPDADKSGKPPRKAGTPADGWPTGGTQVQGFHLCTPCGNGIYPGEHIYDNGDNTVRCAVCEVKHRATPTPAEPAGEPGEPIGYEIVATRLHRDGLGALRSGEVVASAVSTRPTLAEAVDELRRAITAEPAGTEDGAPA